jgi:RNA polymerase sigma-70 factor, ECF subfamily
MSIGEAELFARFAQRIRLYGLRHLGDAAAADDLVQRVLVVVIESLRAGTVREPDRLDSFVLGTARMVARSIWSGERRRDGLLERYGAREEVAGERPSELDLERLRGCVERLAPRERAVVVLSFYAGRSGHDIAQELEMTAGNVRVVRHRAIGRLKACMGIAEAEP